MPYRFHNRITPVLARHLEAWARLCQARIELWTAGWATTVERADKRERSLSEAAEPDAQTVQRSLRGVERSLRRMDRFVPGVTCIHRAIAAQRMLTDRKICAGLVIGLRRGEDAIEGHAWIEVAIGDRILRAFCGDGAAYRRVS